jgi:hypothetical protein
MEESNWDEILASYEAQANLKPGDELEGLVSSIKTATAAELWGDAARNPDSSLIELEILVPSTKSIFREAFSLAKNPASWRNLSFKLGRYRTKYGGLPKEGDQIKVTVNDKGFYAVSL